MLEVNDIKIDFDNIFQNALKSSYKYCGTYGGYYDDYDEYGDIYGTGWYDDECDWWEAYENMKKKDKKKNKKKGKTYYDNNGDLVEIKDNKNKGLLDLYKNDIKKITYYPSIKNKNNMKKFTSLFEFDEFLDDDIKISDLDANYMCRTYEFAVTVKEFENGKKQLIVDNSFDALQYCYNCTYED